MNTTLLREWIMKLALEEKKLQEQISHVKALMDSLIDYDDILSPTVEVDNSDTNTVSAPTNNSQSESLVNFYQDTTGKVKPNKLYDRKDIPPVLDHVIVQTKKGKINVTQEIYNTCLRLSKNFTSTNIRDYFAESPYKALRAVRINYISSKLLKLASQKKIVLIKKGKMSPKGRIPNIYSIKK